MGAEKRNPYGSVVISLWVQVGVLIFNGFYGDSDHQPDLRTTHPLQRTLYSSPVANLVVYSFIFIQRKTKLYKQTYVNMTLCENMLLVLWILNTDNRA